MNLCILYNRDADLLENDPGREAREDVSRVAGALGQALTEDGHRVELLGVGSDPLAFVERLREDPPDLVLNLCESLAADARGEMAVPCLLDLLGIDEPVILGGVSLGGWIAAEFAVRWPERVRKLWLCNAPGLWVEGHPLPDRGTRRGMSMRARSYLLLVSPRDCNALAGRCGTRVAHRTRMRKNVNDWERVVSVAAGAGMVLAAARRATGSRTAGGVTGAVLIARGLSGYCPVNAAIGRGRLRDDPRRAVAGSRGGCSPWRPAVHLIL